MIEGKTGVKGMRILISFLFLAWVGAMLGWLDSSLRETRLRSELVYSEKQTQEVIGYLERATVQLNKSSTQLLSDAATMKACADKRRHTHD
jgi:hypothetical protein